MWYFPDDLFAFVVDTTTYAGSFERQLTAYCTGCVGECGVGERMADLFLEEERSFAEELKNTIAQVPDEHGCLRPASIFPTPGWWNDGLGNEWPNEDWGKEHTIEQYRKAAREAGLEEGRSPGKHPAYLSVAMFFHEAPRQALIRLLEHRAKKFAKEIGAMGGFLPSDGHIEPIPITGLRLVQLKLQVTELWSATERESTHP
jgi:hypothetical protein